MDDMIRDKGYYWVRRGADFSWEIMRWEGRWWRTEEDTRCYEGDVAVTGDRIKEPSEDA